MKNTHYVLTNRGEVLVQVLDGSHWGFSLYSDDQCWPGGFGLGASSWEIVKAAEVSSQIRAELGPLSRFEGLSAGIANRC